MSRGGRCVCCGSARPPFGEDCDSCGLPAAGNFNPSIARIKFPDDAEQKEKPAFAGDGGSKIAPETKDNAALLNADPGPGPKTLAWPA